MASVQQFYCVSVALIPLWPYYSLYLFGVNLTSELRFCSITNILCLELEKEEETHVYTVRCLESFTAEDCVWAREVEQIICEVEFEPPRPQPPICIFEIAKRHYHPWWVRVMSTTRVPFISLLWIQGGRQESTHISQFHRFERIKTIKPLRSRSVRAFERTRPLQAARQHSDWWHVFKFIYLLVLQLKFSYCELLLLSLSIE